MNAAPSPSSNPTVQAVSETMRQVIRSLGRAHHVSQPFDYWLLSDILPERAINDILALPFAAPTNPTFDGRRESNNSSRTYFSRDNQARHAICREVAEAFNSSPVVDKLGGMIGRDLSAGRLRIEYCQDRDGFWLEPHRDISVKMLTMLVYLSSDSRLVDAGTDIYDASPEHKLVASAPYGKNKGLIFAPGANTWHGLSKRPIRDLRRSLIINFVSAEWRQTEELAFPGGRVNA